MGRRDDDERPPVEIWGEEHPSADDVQRVELRSGGRDRRVVGIILAVVGALVVAGLLIEDGSGDDEAGDEEAAESSTSTTRRTTTTTTVRRTTTTTTTTTLPAGPMLPGPTEAGLLLVGGAGSTVVYVDLDTGARVDIDPTPADGLPTVVQGGVVVVSAGRATYVPLPTGEHVDLSVDAGSVGQVLATPGGDRVWLIEDAWSSDAPTPAARLVDVSGASAGSPVALDDCCPVGATEDGIVVERGGRVFELTPAGARWLADGTPFGQARNGLLVVASCDDQASCRAGVLDLIGGTITDVGPLPDDVARWGAEAVPSPDGRVAWTIWGPTVTMLVQDEGGMVAQSLDTSTQAGRLDWLPGGLGLVGGVGGRAVHLEIDDDELVASPLPGLEDSSVEMVFLIPR